jgi:hypothetical protein
MKTDAQLKNDVMKELRSRTYRVEVTAMRKQNWRMMMWCLTGTVSLCLAGESAMGQASFAVPQAPQYVQYPQGAPPVTPAVPGAQVALSADQMDQLLGSIALYPDPLLSLIFPAASYPQDVTAAEGWLQNTPDPTEADIASQPWDASIKGLVHYPTVLKMMSDQINWTAAVGAAFVNQQPDVLKSVQHLRVEAQAAQNLQTNQQEQIVADGNSIRIEPVDPSMIYVPQYDPNLVYASRYSVIFGDGYPIGLWCDNDFDWNDGYIVDGGGWYRGWRHPQEWDRNRPAWYGRDGWGAAAPQRWARTSRRPAPQLTYGTVAQLGLDRPRGGTAVNGAARAARSVSSPLPVGRQSAPAPSRNVFDPAQSRNQVQSAVQRVRPTAAPVAATPAAPSRVAPARVAPSPAAPSHVAPARSAPVRAAPARAAPRSAPSNAFRGSSAGATRAQSSRGHASSGGHHR